jgi:hypothetical protein
MAESRDACLAGLRRALQRDPEALGLRRTMTAAGARLVDVAEEIAEARVDEFLGADRADMSREDRFVAAFVRRVAGTGGLGADAVVRGTSYHCGACFPCLIRRSGMHHAMGDDPTHYRRTLPDIALEEEGADLRAIVRWLSRPFTVLDVVADMPLPDDVNPHDLVAVLRRGRHELAAMKSPSDPLLPIVRPDPVLHRAPAVVLLVR